MPTISRFLGIKIIMQYADHNPPHFHADYNGEKVYINIQTFALMAGKMSPRALSLVLERAMLHQKELMKNREISQLWDGTLLEQIEPLA